MRWKDEKTYEYLKFPSCGQALQGYVPCFVHDGSNDHSGIPNFFEVDKDEGVDKPGDPLIQIKNGVATRTSSCS